MKCPICGNDYRPCYDGVNCELNEDSGIMIINHLYYCSDCEKVYDVKAQFKLDAIEFNPMA